MGVGTFIGSMLFSLTCGRLIMCKVPEVVYGLLHKLNCLDGMDETNGMEMMQKSFQIFFITSQWQIHGMYIDRY